MVYLHDIHVLGCVSYANQMEPYCQDMFKNGPSDAQFHAFKIAAVAKLTYSSNIIVLE